MKKLLYITCNSKPEETSASKVVARHFLNKLTSSKKDFEVEELDLYKIDIPQLQANYLDGRSTLVDGDCYNKLSSNDQNNINQIKSLAEQFKQADFYIISAPLWNMKTPSPLSNYFDAVNINEITVTISPDNVGGLLNDKDRTAVYIQSSGGCVSDDSCGQKNYPGLYIHDLLSFMGIKNYHEILVENTGYTADEQHSAVLKGKECADKLVQKL